MRQERVQVMARRVSDETVTRRVVRNGVMYEFTRYSEPAFNAMGHEFGSLTELTARRWNGYQWVHLHRIFIREGDTDHGTEVRTEDA